jgi:hypothetical protein
LRSAFINIQVDKEFPMRSWLALLLTMLMSLLLPLNVSAQNGVVFDKVEVAIWPEYDKPGALVIYHLALSPKVNLPADVSFRIPKAAGKPSAVAYQDVDGTLTNLNYTTTADGDWNRISFSTLAPLVQIEYYDPGLTKTGTKRNFEYRWPGDQAVNAMSVQVQQPLNASNMQITPSLGSGQQQKDGLVYYDKAVGELKAGTPFSVKLAYDKKDDTLSFSSQPVQPAAPINASTPGRLTFQEVLPWILGGLGLLLVAGGVLWYFISSRDQRVPAGHRHRAAAVPARESRGRASEAGASTTTKEAIYCHQCGRRANAGDVFCRTCGTKLRL